MDMHQSPAGLLDAIRAGRAPVAPLPAEWRSLAAQLAAAHALRQSLGADDNAAATKGSFDPGVARALAKANDQACPAVNPFASNDGKPAGGKTMAHAGTPFPAIEG